MKNSIQNQKGIALITTLMLVVLGFGVVAIMLRLSTQETKLARLRTRLYNRTGCGKGRDRPFHFHCAKWIGTGHSTDPAFRSGLQSEQLS